MTFYIETKRLILKTPNIADFDYLFSLYNNPKVMRYIGDGNLRDKEKTNNLLNKFCEHQTNHGFSMGPVFEKSSNNFIGFAGLIYLGLDLDANQPDIEVGYSLLPKYWRLGYATELSRACIQWGLENLTINKLVGITHLENIKSQQVLIKAGFKKIKIDTYNNNKVIRFEKSNCSKYQNQSIS